MTNMNIKLFNPLVEVTSEQAQTFEVELRKEIPDGHILKGEDFECIARREDRDDFLFYVTSMGKFAVVHLTWNQEKSSEWPMTRLYSSFEELKQKWSEDFF